MIVFSFPVTIELPILFFCVENTRSQMVEGFFDKYAPKGYGITLMIFENMRNPDIQICNLLKTKMNEIILKINQTYTILESDKLHSELRI